MSTEVLAARPRGIFAAKRAPDIFEALNLAVAEAPALMQEILDHDLMLGWAFYHSGRSAARGRSCACGGLFYYRIAALRARTQALEAFRSRQKASLLESPPQVSTLA